MVLLFALSVASAQDWTAWRGPNQDATATAPALTEAVRAGDLPIAWASPHGGRGTPVIQGDQLVVWSTDGEGANLVERLSALDVGTGEARWTLRSRDFLSDIIYDRYTIGAPTIDPATGLIAHLTSAGLLRVVEPDGVVRWERSLMEHDGRLTFPNGRTAAPLIVGDQVILHGIFAGWGPFAMGRDRLYAFSLNDGAPTWVSTPGTRAWDNSYSTPLVLPRPEHPTTLAFGTGCGHLAAVRADTGSPLWRHPLARGGLDATPVRAGSLIVGGHAREDLTRTAGGRVVSLDPFAEAAPPDHPGPTWTAPLSLGSSSPVHQQGRVYLTSPTGQLHTLDASTGALLGSLDLATSQLHGSPVMVDGLLWIPLHGGTLAIVEPDDGGGRVLHQRSLDGDALGAPAVANGMVFVQTTTTLYAFGTPGDAAPAQAAAPSATARTTTVRPHPAHLTLRAGASATLQLAEVDADGGVLRTFTPTTATALDGVRLDGATVHATSAPAVLPITLHHNGASWTVPVRVLPALPYTLDLGEALGGQPTAKPPAAWIGGHPKWRVERVEGTPTLVKQLDNPFFQRVSTFLGHPDDSGYTMNATVRFGGDRRSGATVGLISHRYLIALKGGQGALELSSNQERLRVSVPMKLEPNVWHHLEVRVDPNPDSGITRVRARTWPEGGTKPDGWPLDHAHPEGHNQGAAGLYAFTPQNRHQAMIRALHITPNDAEASP